MKFGLVNIFTMLLITIGPLKVMLAFGDLSAEADSEFRHRVSKKAVLVALIACLVFALLGALLLHIFQLSLPALKIAGGIILLLFALHMVMAEADKPQGSLPPKPSESIAIYPLAMPMMASPQGIVTIVTLMAATSSVLRALTIVASILVVMRINLFVMRSAERIIATIGIGTLQVIGRVAGILLCALAVELMLSALADLNLGYIQKGSAQ